MLKKILAFILITYLFALLSLSLFSANIHLYISPLDNIGRAPNFSAYEDVTARKTAFFEFLIPLIDSANQNLKNERQALLEIREYYQHKNTLRPAHRRQLAVWLAHYTSNSGEIPSSQGEVEMFSILETRINQIPSSLVLAQAANESAWGTSRFAREANNLFGEWCFKPGCGVIPKNRSAGAKHEVRKFATIKDSISSYFKNINSHEAYQQLRKIRQQLQVENKKLSGYILAGGLIKYSEKGQLYIDEIRQMIISNKLE